MDHLALSYIYLPEVTYHWVFLKVCLVFYQFLSHQNHRHRVIVFHSFPSFGCSWGPHFVCLGLLSFFCCFVAFFHRLRVFDRVTVPLGSQQVENPDLPVNQQISFESTGVCEQPFVFIMCLSSPVNSPSKLFVLNLYLHPLVWDPLLFASVAQCRSEST